MTLDARALSRLAGRAKRVAPTTRVTVTAAELRELVESERSAQRHRRVLLAALGPWAERAGT